jgi:glyoxylase-like metal-dependent hydrolase (beta-lactamase superfamily II)
LRAVLIDSRSLWFAQTNTYVVAPERGGPAVVIDAPPDPDGLIGLLSKHALIPVALLVTHGHVDHVGGAGAVSRRIDVSAYVHPDDDFLSLDPESQLRGLFGMVPPGDYEPPTRFEHLGDGQLLTLAGLEIEVRQTPGHTPGHCCFYLASEGELFSGDQLFAGSIGRTDLPGGDFGALMDSMSAKVMSLDDSVVVRPGHGPSTTIGAERATNPFLVGLP